MDTTIDQVGPSPVDEHLLDCLVLSVEFARLGKDSKPVTEKERELLYEYADRTIREYGWLKMVIDGWLNMDVDEDGYVTYEASDKLLRHQQMEMEQINKEREELDGGVGTGTEEEAGDAGTTVVPDSLCEET